jgi:hypothetical protein
MEIDGAGFGITVMQPPPWKIALQIADGLEWITTLLETLPTKSPKR